MEEKFNNATAQRPEGYRQLDGGLMVVDLPKYIHQIKEETAYRENGKNAITVFKSDNTTITLVALRSGENIHSGPEDVHILINLYLIAGDLLFTSMQNKEHLSEGQLLNCHESSSFKIEAKSDCIGLLTIIK